MMSPDDTGCCELDIIISQPIFSAEAGWYDIAVRHIGGKNKSYGAIAYDGTDYLFKRHGVGQPVVRYAEFHHLIQHCVLGFLVRKELPFNPNIDLYFHNVTGEWIDDFVEWFGSYTEPYTMEIMAPSVAYPIHGPICPAA